MRLTFEWKINNEVRITSSSEPLSLPKRTDTAILERLERRGRASQAYFDCNRLLDSLLYESKDSGEYATFDGLQGNLFGAPEPVNTTLGRTPVLPECYKALVPSRSGGFKIEWKSTRNLLDDRRAQLDIIRESQRKIDKHSSYGRTQTVKAFTREARSHLLQCGAALDKMGLTEESSLLTLTLPGGTPEAKEALSRWSGWIVNRQLQAVRRELRGERCHWFFVWELQQRGALHQHWCLTNENYWESRYLSMVLKDTWYKCLVEIGKLEGIDMFQEHLRRYSHVDKPENWQWNEQKAEKSLGAYFSKYASKTANDLGKNPTSDEPVSYCPSRWHGSSSSLKEIVKNHYIKVVLTGIQRDEVDHLKDCILGMIDFDDVVIGYEYDFRIEGKDSFCFNEGTKTILYLSDAEYLRYSARFHEFCNTAVERVEGRSELNWRLHLYREQKAMMDGVDTSPVFSYGRAMTFC